jgi:putative YphP/YqiW family bacilliredoxin
MAYSPLMAQAMRDEVTRLGVVELRTPAEVDRFLAERDGPSLVFVNSVCGCAAGNARPALLLAVQDAACPQRRATVFAGQDPEATAHLRSYHPDLAPSSPCFLVLRDGKVTTYVPRHQIEGHSAEAIAGRLREAFRELAGSAAE